ncbi:uncharacterized protein ymp [Drosophila tropicalis]|uniref:uncharacterized protein ymp n=1 Tax=Drosophila tropicalis TaxID=46794 RepID=UPI0035ABD737
MALSILVGALKTPAILQPIKKTILTSRTPIRNGCIFCRPEVDFLEKPSVIFSKEAVSHHWGAVPMILICGFGFALEVLAWIRIAATRDDVWYTKGAAACEVIETRKGYPPPIRKFKVYNQKYETPAGLVEAMQGDTLGPPSKDQNKKK